MTVLFDRLAHGKVIHVQVSDKLTREDYKRFVPEIEQLIKEHGKVRMLFDMLDFHGWKAGALWDDVKFDIKHFNDFERIAMVGDKRWEEGMAIFCKPFTSAAVRYFDRNEEDEAREWILEGLPAEARTGKAI